MSQQLIDQFWKDVRTLLVEQYRFTEEQANRGIADYRHLLELAGVGETVFNRGEEEAADAIAAAMEMQLVKK